jgi:hypothetical protein
VLLLHRKRISQKLYRKLPHNSAGTHGTQQAWINSRNLTNIATQSKHRQPIFLHPTDEAGESGALWPVSVQQHRPGSGLVRISSDGVILSAAAFQAEGRISFSALSLFKEDLS